VDCSNCGAANRGEAKFCVECGAALAITCPNGHPVPRTARFCDECGAPVQGTQPLAPAISKPPPLEPSAERRLVSVLFAELVGFTSLSEGRDYEDVRELLGRYFDTARRLVALYGGTIEKFIGDAVMAVWGTPVAQEDDAERAVRAALDLTAAVAEIGAETGAADLRARAGVLTGEAAVTIGAQGQGMVAGDLVNTASRIQSAAKPGGVLVGETTRRATEAAVIYEDAGMHEMKGKAEPVPLWRAVRVVAGRGGALKATSLEAPFVGRDRELRLIKEMFHASAEEKRAHLLSVIGIAGIGKSRLAWEFEKYVDGLLQLFPWHRGRCLAYGEGVTYWALAEMVRMRARIVEAEEPATAYAKLRATIEEYVHDPDEREWIEPRLAHLLGLEDRNARDPEDLFSAWRLFFERLSEDGPTILIFEDMQWADPSLVDFVDYLMNWSKNHPIFVLVLARPDFVDKHPTWGAGRRGYTTQYLEPLSQETMDELLAGLVPGLPAQLRAKILDRAEGVPLYAVETVRMLLDRGLLVQEGSAYRPTGPVEDLEVPETLQALIAARLDGLETAERRLIQDAAVVGKTFTKASLAALTGLAETEIETVLSSLLRKEFLSLQADPRSPERGQYGFLQDLVRRVAYDTLSRKDRKARHLAAAAYLASSWGSEDDEVVEVVAAHYLEAYHAAPDAPDAPAIKVKARDALVSAGRRAQSLAAGEEARRYYEQAIELTDDPLQRAELDERAGRMARAGGRFDEAVAHYESAMALFEAAGKSHPAARVSAAYADLIRDLGRGEEALERMQAAFAVLSGEQPDADLATLAAQLGRLLHFTGRGDEALASIELALTIAEALLLPEVLSQALNTKAIILLAAGRIQESLVLLQHALQVALDNDIPDAALRAYNNIGAAMNDRDDHDEELAVTARMVDLARRVGDRTWERRGGLGGLTPLLYVGRWDEGLALYAEFVEAGEVETRSILTELSTVPPIFVWRGELEAAREVIDSMSPMRDSTDIQERSTYDCAKAWVLLGEGKDAEALEVGRKAFETGVQLGVRGPCAKEGLTAMMEAALALSDVGTVERQLLLIDGLRPGEIAPYIAAQAFRWRARLGALQRASQLDTFFEKAADRFREINMPFWRAVTQLEHGEWLVSSAREVQAKPLFDQAREAFKRLKARPWLDRLARAAGELPELSQAPTG